MVILIGLSSAVFAHIDIVKRLLVVLTQVAEIKNNATSIINITNIYSRLNFFILWNFTASIWFCVVSTLARTNKMIPKGLTLLGFGLSLIYLISLIGILTLNQNIIDLYRYIAMVIIPIWSVAEGGFLWRLSLKDHKISKANVI